MPDPVNRMPAETLTAEQLRDAFAAKGISAQELVALSGAHTVLAPAALLSTESLHGRGHGLSLSNLSCPAKQLPSLDRTLVQVINCTPCSDPMPELKVSGLIVQHIA